MSAKNFNIFIFRGFKKQCQFSYDVDDFMSNLYLLAIRS